MQQNSSCSIFRTELIFVFFSNVSSRWLTSFDEISCVSEMSIRLRLKYLSEYFYKGKLTLVLVNAQMIFNLTAFLEPSTKIDRRITNLIRLH